VSVGKGTLRLSGQCHAHTSRFLGAVAQDALGNFHLLDAKDVDIVPVDRCWVICVALCVYHCVRIEVVEARGDDGGRVEGEGRQNESRGRQAESRGWQAESRGRWGGRRGCECSLVGGERHGDRLEDTRRSGRGIANYRTSPAMCPGYRNPAECTAVSSPTRPRSS